jgi:hypothetical protein
MKKLLLILILIVFGCKDKKETEFIKEQEQRKEKGKVKNVSYADMLLEMDAEKLMLLSILKKTPQDTLRLVLRDYLKENQYTEYGNFTDNIDTISQKYHISKFKIASIIFSYKYEMLTKEEIEESAIESYQDNNPE